jgi:hypothetical protein
MTIERCGRIDPIRTVELSGAHALPAMRKAATVQD